MCRFARSTALAVAVAVCLGLALPVNAQYFGRNKVQYDDFDFSILRTEHFDIYYYPEEEQAVQDAARMAERWYRRHSRTFLREFAERKPIIFYANDADFHQTNVIGGQIGEGTGGVTEGLKERVVMPLTGSYKETDHVLGHELVHSFQYDIALNRRDSTRFALGAMPLWLMEGMAEYLSVGRVDPHTAMWLRDAIVQDDLPTIEQITRDYRYFPYRYGQAYLAYIGGKYGDAAVANLYKLAGRAGVDTAMVYTLGIRPDSLSKEWQQVVRQTYEPLMADRWAAEQAGRKVLAPETVGGSMNIGPVVSPDGQYVAFLSERDLFNINLFIADAETGEVIKRLKSGNADPHFDALRFIASAGSWSPDGRYLAFVTFVEGDNEITIFDVEERDIDRRFAIEGVTALSNPAWSPDGRSIAVSGLDGGISDLYVLDLETRAVRQLTDDRYADLQPTWSPDGQTIAFVTDRGPDGTEFDELSYANYRLGLIDAGSGAVETVQPFANALHHNPQYAPDGRSLYFISDQDGFKDIYRYEFESELVSRVTYLKTGVSGITATSPAMSIAAQSGRMMFSVFDDGEYVVYSREPDEIVGTPVEAQPPDAIASAAILPPVLAVNEGLVGSYLNDPLTGLPPASTDYAVRDYKPSLQLDYVAPPTVGVSAGGPFGSQVGGGVGFYFSDMLGNRNLAIAAQANGTFKDIGGQVTYLDVGNRFNFGGTAGHIPLQYAYAMGGFDPQSGTQIVEYLRQRIFIDQVAGLAQYPFSTTRRFETSAGFVRYGFDNEVEQYMIAPNGLSSRDRIDPDDSFFFQGIREQAPIYFFQASGAYVGDYSFFAFTSPVQGGRYRFEVSPQVGSYTYVGLLADYRRYFMFRPVTFAVRGLHIGNYGASGEDRFTRQYLGYSYYPGFVRGYSFNSFDVEECSGSTMTSSCPELDRLFGTHIAMGSVELRLPFFGTEQFGLINFPYLPTELSAFFDGGVAWDGEGLPELAFSTNPDEQRRVPVFSTGLSARFNVLGYVVLEAYYAYPFQRPERGAHFGFQLAPGW